MIKSAAVSPDEFAVFVYVSIQQQTVLNSPHYEQNMEKRIWANPNFCFTIHVFILKHHTPDSKLATWLTASSTAVINLSDSHSVRAWLSEGTQLLILIGCGSVMDSTRLSALLGLCCLALWGAGFSSDAVSLKGQRAEAY